jgi:glycosyltransferase involved in cell wall biosynthesis
MKNKTGILFVINDFNVGGAELFVFRLGIALQTNYSIYILDLFPDNCDVEFRRQFIESGFVLLNRYNELSNFKEKLFWKINAFFSIVGIKGVYSKLKKKEQQKLLLNAINKNSIKIIHSHYFSADAFVRNNLVSNALKWVMTMHGDYNHSVYNKMGKEKELFLITAKENVQQADALTYVADVNLALLNEFELAPIHLKKIRLGLSNRLTKNNLNLEKEDFTFCMVARSNPDKGWEILVKAFIELNGKFPDTKLYCVGPIEGAVEELAEKYSKHEKIEFTGYTNSPSDYILKSDVGVLPTYFEGESSPYSVIEYLSCNKPVIATDNGEIRDMLSANDDIAGIVIQLQADNKPSVKELMEAMEILMLDKILYEEKVKLTPLAFDKFTIERCKKEYVELYENLLKV